jgi:hypothetical protein
MNGTTRGTVSSEGGTFLGLCRLWGRELVDWNYCRSRTWVWGCLCGEWTTRRVRSPCGLIASAGGGLLLRENEQQVPMDGRFILHTHPVGYIYKQISFVVLL